MRRSDAPAPIAVVTALKEELAPILKRTRGVSRAPGGGRIFFGRLGSVDAILAATGDGLFCARAGAQALLDAFRPTALYGAGIAGALSPKLSSGDLILSRRVRRRDGDGPPPDAALLSRALASPEEAVAGTLVTVERPVVTPEEKRRLASQLADGEPAAVDMESVGWAEAAAARGVAYLVVRAISDEAGDGLPEFLPRCVASDGRLRRSAVVAHALTKPASVPTLFQLRRRLLAGSERVADFLERLLGEEK
jgi:adenosylhomocysteine nucleosidase